MSVLLVTNSQRTVALLYRYNFFLHNSCLCNFCVQFKRDLQTVKNILIKVFRYHAVKHMFFCCCGKRNLLSF